MRLLRLFILLLLVFASLWGMGFYQFMRQVHAPAVVVAAGEVEAIIVLTGGSDRFMAGLSLLEQGVASELFVSGVGYGVRVKDLLLEEGIEDQERAYQRITPHIMLGREARDTRGNAAEVAQWVAEKGIKKLVLVTSNYHMPRSLLEMRQAMPDVTFLPHPVKPKAVVVEQWWDFPGTRKLLLNEYHKYLAVLMRREFIKRGEG